MAIFDRRKEKCRSLLMMSQNFSVTAEDVPRNIPCYSLFIDPSVTRLAARLKKMHNFQQEKRTVLESGEGLGHQSLVN